MAKDTEEYPYRGPTDENLVGDAMAERTASITGLLPIGSMVYAGYKVLKNNETQLGIFSEKLNEAITNRAEELQRGVDWATKEANRDRILSEMHHGIEQAGGWQGPGMIAGGLVIASIVAAIVFPMISRNQGIEQVKNAKEDHATLVEKNKLLKAELRGLRDGVYLGRVEKAPEMGLSA